MVARLLWEQDAAGSSPVTSTKTKDRGFCLGLFVLQIQIQDSKGAVVNDSPVDCQRRDDRAA